MGTDYKTRRSKQACAWGEKKMYGKTYEGLIRSHFGVDEDGRLAEVAHKVKPLITADLALKLVKL